MEEEKQKQEVPAEAPKEQPKEEKPPEPKRKYIRSFGFMFNHSGRASFIQGTLYQLDGKKLDIEGLCDEIAYDSTENLVKIMQWNPEVHKLFVDKVQTFINFQ